MKHLFNHTWPSILGGIMAMVLINIWYPGFAGADAISKNEGSPTRQQTLVIGKVTEDPKKQYRYMKPIVDYAASHMKDLGIRETKVLMAKNNRQMVSYFRQGKIDWMTETAFSAVYFQKKAGAQYFLKKWKKGVGQYHSVFFTRKDTGIKTLADLKGKTIAFEDPGSTSAYFVPASILIEKGLNLVQLATIREKPPADMVGYVFSRQEVNTSTWVSRGLVDVGVFNNLDWNKDDHMRKAQRKEMTVIHESGPFPRAIELVRKDLDPQIQDRLKSVLLNAHKDPKAKTALKAYQKTKKFEEIDADCLASLEEAGRILKLVRLELE